MQTAGITLRLKGVQIIKLIEYDVAKHYGVEDEVDGEGCYRYDAPAVEPSPKNATPQDTPVDDTPVDVEQLADEERELAPVGEIASNRGDDDIPF